MFGWLRKILLKIKNLNKSIDEYKKDSVIQSLPTVAYLNQAKKLMDEMKYSQAEDILLKALELSTQDGFVYKYLGQISEYKKDYAKAVLYYKKCAKLEQSDKEVWRRLSFCQAQLNFLDDALFSIEKADGRTPNNSDIYYDWGMIYFRDKKYSLARDKFMKSAQLNRFNFMALLLSAVMDKKLEDYQFAQDKLEFLIKVAPMDTTYYEYAHLKLLKSEYKEAEEFAKKSIELNPQMLPSYVILGEIYSLHRETSKFEMNFEIALDNDLESSILRYEWGKAYLRVFDWQKAKEQFLLTLKLDEHFEDAQIALALTYAYENDFEVLHNLDIINEENCFYIEAMGLEKLAVCDSHGAIELFKKAINMDREEIYNYYNLVNAYKLIEDNYKIKEYYEKFVQMAPDYFEGIFDYGKWLFGLGEYEEAIRKFRRAAKIDADNLEMLNLLFFSMYTIALKTDCEYNIKEAIEVAKKAQNLGKFDYPEELAQLESKV